MKFKFLICIIATIPPMKKLTIAAVRHNSRFISSLIVEPNQNRTGIEPEPSLFKAGLCVEFFKYFIFEPEAFNLFIHPLIALSFHIVMLLYCCVGLLCAVVLFCYGMSFARFHNFLTYNS